MDDRQEPAERPEPDLTELAEKIRRHRGEHRPVQPLTGYFVAVRTGKTRKQHRIGCSLHMMLSVLLTLGYLTVQDMYSQMHPYVPEVEEGTQNLALRTAVIQIERKQIFYHLTTNSHFAIILLLCFQSMSSISSISLFFAR